jgi:hypothetical protein
MIMDPKKTELTSLFYSLGMHMIIVSFLLTLPISKGEVRLQSLSELIVYPQEEKGDALPLAPAAPKAVIPRIGSATKAQREPLRKSNETHVKRGGNGPGDELLQEKTGTPKRETAKAPGKKEFAQASPLHTNRVETKSVETKPVEKAAAPAAPPEAAPEVKEETGTELVTVEETPEPQESNYEEREIEENTQKEPDMAAKPPVPLVAERKMRQEIAGKMMSVPPKTKGAEAENKGNKTENNERGSRNAAKPPVPLVAERKIRQEIAGKMMSVPPGEKFAEAETRGADSEKGQLRKASEEGGEKSPPPVTPSLLESFWKDVALSSPAPVAPSLRLIPSEGGTPAATRSSGSAAKTVSAGQKPGTAGKETEGKRNKPGIERPGLGIPLSEALLSRGVRIEVLLDAAGDPEVEMRLVRKPYPSTGDRKTSQAKKNVETTQGREELKSEGTPRVKRSFSVENAEKGIYTFVMENKGGNAWEADLSFVFYKGGRKEKTKKYDAVKVAGNGVAKFKFLFPDMIFWDDEDAFTGSIEDSDSFTKFNSDTGLLWKEEKDQGR